MNLNIGDKIQGFTCTSIRECIELNGRLVQMMHDETGAELCWADNGESNKLFSVALRTLPSDNTGVFHILEHSVLCGSDRFPVKEPFVELLKSSMNTFLNAMTFPDKTLYPVSSRNEHDFMNLMSVYLDAVFSPLILKNANIFYQEGHHIEQTEEGLRFNGVVFNEMKGAMAGADEAIGQKMLSLLYPDTCYGYNSGGDPEEIPELTYEGFLDAYRRFYHPSNARFYLDGDIPLENTLKMINTAISGRGRRTDIPDVVMQKPVGCEYAGKFEIAHNEPKTDRTRMEIAKIIGTWRDQTKIMALNVLADVLTGSNESYLTRAVLEAGLAQDVDMDVEGGIAQPYAILSFKNIPDGKVEELKNLVRKETEKLVNDGIDRRSLKASLNCYEFRVREPKEPAALLRCMNSFNTWLYGGDPIDGVAYEEGFVKLNRMIEEGGFEKLLSEILLDENGRCTIVSVPSYSLSAQKDEIEKAKLAAIAEKWTDEERCANAVLNEKLRLWQEMGDTPEALDTLPKLTLSEVDPEPEFTDTEVNSVNGVQVLYHPVPSNGIINFSLYFRLTDRTLEEMPKLSMLENLLGALGTDKYSAQELEETIKNDIGRMSFAMKVLTCRKDRTKCVPMLAARCSVLEANLDKAKELITEILLHTDFSDEVRVREILLQLNDYNREAGPSAGHTIARACTMAHYGADLAAAEAISGYTAARWLRAAAEQPDKSAADICGYLSGLQKEIFTRSRMTVSVTASDRADMADMIDKYEAGTCVPENVFYQTTLPKKMGVVIPAQIGFSAQSGYTRDYCGALRVASNILSLDYLWNVVRVRGGAYGTGIVAGRSGIVSTYSYRDPSPEGSLKANLNAADYLLSFCDNGQAHEKYVISAISNTEPLLSPAKRGIHADDDYMEGFDREYKRRIRREMLETGIDDLRRCADIIENFAAEGDTCIVAGEAILEHCEGYTITEW